MHLIHNLLHKILSVFNQTKKKALGVLIAAAMVITSLSSFGVVAAQAEPADDMMYTAVIEQTDGGEISFASTGDDPAMFAEGEEAAVCAYPDEGYQFNCIQIKDTDTGEMIAGETNGTDENTYVFTMPDTDVTVMALFTDDPGKEAGETLAVENPAKGAEEAATLDDIGGAVVFDDTEDPVIPGGMDNERTIETYGTTSTDRYDITLTTNKESYGIGNTVYYTLTINYTESANGIYGYCFLPSGLTYNGMMSAMHNGRSFSYFYDNVNNGFEIEDMSETVSAGDVFEFVFSGTINTEGEYTTTAHMDDGTSVSTSFSAAGEKTPDPVLEIETKADKKSYNIGDTVTYTITVTETEKNAEAQTVWVGDTLPGEVELIEATAYNGTKDVSGEIDYNFSKDNSFDLWDGGSLSYGDTLTVYVTATAVKSGANIENTASTAYYYGSSSNAGGWFPLGQVYGSAYIDIVGNPELSITKTADADTYEVGDIITYTIEVNQTVSGAAAKNVEISDIIPDGLTIVGDPVVSGLWQYEKSGTLEFEATTETQYEDHTARFSHYMGMYPTTRFEATDVEIVSLKSKAHGTLDPDNYTRRGTDVEFNRSANGSTSCNVAVWANDTSYQFDDDEIIGDFIVTYEQYTSNINAKVNGNTVTVNIDELGYGEPVTVTIQALVGDSLAGKEVTNTAVIDADNADEEDDAVTVDIIAHDPELSITKTADANVHNVGETVVYTITVDQTVDGATARGVVMEDVLPGELVLKDVSTTSGTVNKNGNGFTVNIGDMTASDTAVITVTATAADAGTNIKNTATAVADNATQVSDDAVVTILKSSLSIVKSADGTVYNVGDTITYTIDVKQTAKGARAANVVVTDTLPAGLTLTETPTITSSVSGTAVTVNGNSITANIGTMTESDTATITVKALIGAAYAGGSVSNTASVTDSEGDEENSTCMVNVLSPGISVTKNADADLYNTGDTVTYTLTVNETEVNAVDFNVTVTDELPSGLTLKGTPSITGVGSTVTINGNTITATIPKITYDDTVTVTVTATVDNGTYGETLTNTAVATDQYGNKDDDAATIGVYAPAVSITKTSDKEQYNVGDTVSYTISVRETAQGAVAKDLEVTDNLPSGLTVEGTPVISGAKGKVGVNGQDITVTIDELGFNETATITVNATAGMSLAGKEFTNIATVNGPGINEEKDEVTNAVVMPGVAIDNSVSAGPYNARDEITYTLTITETAANSYTEDVVVTDEIPAGLTINGTPKLSGASGNVSVDGNAIMVNIPRLTSTETATVLINATIGPELIGKSTTNTAYVTDVYGNTDTSENTIDILHPDLKVTKSAGNGPFNVGDTIKYTLTLYESVEDAVSYDVYLEDDLPEGLTATGRIEVSGVDYDRAYVDGNSAIVSIPSLAYGETATVIVEAVIDASAVGKEIDNEACAWDAYDDVDRAKASITVMQPTLSAMTITDGTWYSVNDIVTYTITIGEAVSGAVARNVVVTDTLPSELELISVETTMGSVDIMPGRLALMPTKINMLISNSNSFTVSVGDVWATDTATITVKARAVMEGENIINTAYVSADYCDEISTDAQIAVRRPDIAITKTADDTEYYPDDTVTYTITVENEMNNETAADPETIPTAYNVKVWDTVPEELELISVSDDIGSTFTIDDNYFETTYPAMYYGETHEITVTAKAYDVGNRTVDNTAYVVSDTTEELSDYAKIDIVKPIMSIDKSVDDETHSVGEDIVYTINVRQTVEGLSAYNTTVTDMLPDEMELTDAILEGVDGDITIDGNTFTANIPKLGFGETAAVTLTAKATTPLDDVTNTAYVTADHAAPDLDRADVDILQPVLDIEKTADKENYNVGDTVTYTILASQMTEDAAAYNAVIKDTMPDGLILQDVTLSGAEGDIDILDNGFTVTYGKLSDTDAYVTATALVDDNAGDMTLTNTATVTADNADPAENDVDIYARKPVLTVEKTTDKENYYIGDTVEYTIALDQTTDDATAYDVTVTDELPDGLELVDAASETGEVEVNGNIVTVSYDAVSTSKTITVTAKTLEDTGNSEVTNTAVATASNTDDAIDDADIYVMQPELSITKTTDKDAYDTGDTVTYTIIAEQLIENAAEENIVITDTLPDGLTLSDIEISPGGNKVTANGNKITAEIPRLDRKNDVTLTVKATVDNAQEGKKITNTAFASGSHTNKVSDDAVININTVKSITNNQGKNSSSSDTGSSGTDSSGPVKTGQAIGGIMAAVAAALAATGVVITARRRRRI